MTQTGRPMSALEWTLLGLLSLLWGATFFFAEIALRELTPAWLVLLRVAIAATALHLLMIATGTRVPMRPALFTQFAVMGLLNNVIPFTLIFWGQTAIDSGLAAILNATTPFWVVLLAHFFTTDEQATPRKLAGITIGWAGVAMMIGPAAFGGLGSSLLPQLAILLAAFFYAWSGLYARRFRDLPPIAGAAWQLTASSALMAVLVMATQPAPNLAALQPSSWAAVLALALLSTAMAYILFFRILKTAGATNLLLVTLLIPVTAVTLGTLFLGERLDTGEIAGMLLILAGLAVIDGRALAPFKRPSRRSAG